MINEICAELMGGQRKRRHCIKIQSKIDRATEAYIAREGLGYRPEKGDKETGKEVFKRAKRIRIAVERGNGQAPAADLGLSEGAVADCSAVINGGALSRASWDDMRCGVEREMVVLASKLPVSEWVESVRGCTAMVLAVIVGEAGNLSNYPDRSRLQKRLGLGIVDGVRQGNPGPNATDDDWIRHGYNRQRRAEMWAFLDDTLLRAQWRAEKCTIPAHPIGPYGDHYGRKKAEYIERGHPAPDKAARRYMAKMFIRDLWQEWCRVTPAAG